MAFRASQRGSWNVSSLLELAIFTRRRVRMVRQTEASECGVACLAMVASYHGLHVDLMTLRQALQPGTRGTSLGWLMAAADQIGLVPRALKVPLNELRDLELPAILHWDLNHFVVLERVRGGRVLVHNTDGRSRWLTVEELSNHFTGIAIELRPGADFHPGERRQRLRLSRLWARISGLKRSLLQTIMLSIVMQLFVLASPFYMQVAIDTALPALDNGLLIILALGFSLFTAINVVAMLLRSFVLLSAGTSVGFGVAINIVRKLLRLPANWFERRDIGDILSRFQSIAPVKEALTQGSIAIIIDGTMAVITLAAMIYYSGTLAAIAFAAFLLHTLMRIISFSLERGAREDAIVFAGREQSTLIETLRGIHTLRLATRENMRHLLWQSRLADSVNADLRFQRVFIWQSTFNALVFGLELVISIWAAIGMVMEGGFTVGMVFAYLAYKTQFLAKATPLIDQITAFRMLGLHLERLADIALAEEDFSFRDAPACSAILKGGVELRDVSFRYSPSECIVLDRLSLVVEPGENVAITGPSGSGKSTLMKIIVALHEPDEGEVLIDGVPLAQFGYKNFHEQIAVVLQEDNLFAGSLAENISLFDESADMDRIVAAATSAAIHDEIIAMPMGYQTMVGDMGSTLSGGQKQRVLLARALYREPRLLVVDEATSHLDAARESQINASIRKMGCTRIVIAHRLETLAAADRVLTLVDGRLSERLDGPTATGRAVPK
jgi:ATP-binding cassette subfamily B protein RaxB